MRVVPTNGFGELPSKAKLVGFAAMPPGPRSVGFTIAAFAFCDEQRRVVMMAMTSDVSWAACSIVSFLPACAWIWLSSAWRLLQACAVSGIASALSAAFSLA